MSDEKQQKLAAIFLRFPGGYCRPVEIEDMPLMYIWVNDPEIRPLLNRVLLEMLEDENEWLRGVCK